MDDEQIQMLAKPIYQIADQLEGNAFGRDIWATLQGIEKQLNIANRLKAMELLYSISFSDSDKLNIADREEVLEIIADIWKGNLK